MVNIIINKEKLKAFPLKLGPRQLFTFSALNQYNAHILRYRKRKKEKGHK